MDSLKEIEAAWMNWSGYDTSPGSDRDRDASLEAFKNGWAYAKALGEVQRERLEHLHDVEADRDRYREERNTALSESKRLDEQNAKYFAALEKIKEIRWGYDGDCGALAIIDSVL